MGAPEKFTAAQMIDAAKATKGMVYLTAERLGCAPNTVYNYIERHPTVKAAFEAESGKVGDVAELKLYKAIQDAEAWAITFYLRTKGRSRGYAERHEVTGADGNEIVFRVVRERVPDPPADRAP